MTNKELLDKLQEYYLTQDPKTVARCLANCMLDIMRTFCFLELHPDERRSLVERNFQNNRQLQQFIKNGGCSEKLTLHDVSEE